MIGMGCNDNESYIRGHFMTHEHCLDRLLKEYWEPTVFCITLLSLNHDHSSGSTPYNQM